MHLIFMFAMIPFCIILDDEITMHFQCAAYTSEIETFSDAHTFTFDCGTAWTANLAYSMVSMILSRLMEDL